MLQRVKDLQVIFLRKEKGLFLSQILFQKWFKSVLVSSNLSSWQVLHVKMLIKLRVYYTDVPLAAYSKRPL